MHRNKSTSFTNSVSSIPLSVPNIGRTEWISLKKCIDSGWVSSAGPYVAEFEAKFAEYIGSSNAVAIMNGTAAIQIALRIVGIGSGDTVVVPTLTFIASASPASHLGAKVEFVDVSRDDFCLNPLKLEEKLAELKHLGKPAKAVVVVHLYGQSAKMDEILRVSESYGVCVVEDATESLGSTYCGKQTGTLGKVGCFSFNGNKIMTTGGGGMIVTDNDDLAARVKKLVNHGRTHSIEFEYDEIGYNYRLNSLQSALGIAQLERMPEFIAVKRRVASFYARRLSQIPGLTVLEERSKGQSNCWMNVVLVDKEVFGLSARELIGELNKRGIQTRPIFKPLHLLGIFNSTGEFPNAEWIYEHGLNLPCSTGISPDELKIVVSSIDDIYYKARNNSI